MKKHSLDLGPLQNEVAEQIGANPWTIANWEKGLANPVKRFVPKILRFLECDPNK